METIQVLKSDADADVRYFMTGLHQTNNRGQVIFILGGFDLSVHYTLTSTLVKVNPLVSFTFSHTWQYTVLISCLIKLYDSRKTKPSSLIQNLTIVLFLFQNFCLD